MTRRRFTPLQRARIFERAGGACHICGERIDGTKDRWELEHIIPLALGGEDEEENLRPAHQRCHRAKTRQDRKDISKSNRVRAKHMGAWSSKSPLPGGRKSKLKKKIGGGVVERD